MHNLLSETLSKVPPTYHYQYYRSCSSIVFIHFISISDTLICFETLQIHMNGYDRLDYLMAKANTIA